MRKWKKERKQQLQELTETEKLDFNTYYSYEFLYFAVDHKG